MSRDQSSRILTTLCAAGLLLSACSSAGKEQNASPSQSQSANPSATQTISDDSVTPFTKAAWRLSSVEHAGKTVTIPHTLNATMKFRSNGQIVLFNDLVNTISGKITFTDAGYVISGQATTLAGYAGSDPTIRIVMDAMAAAANMLPKSKAKPPPVRALVIRSQLVLQARDYKLIFDRL